MSLALWSIFSVFYAITILLHFGKRTHVFLCIWPFFIPNIHLRKELSVFYAITILTIHATKLIKCEQYDYQTNMQKFLQEHIKNKHSFKTNIEKFKPAIIMLQETKVYRKVLNYDTFELLRNWWMWRFSYMHTIPWLQLLSLKEVMVLRYWMYN